jgi:hypothetical protein
MSLEGDYLGEMQRMSLDLDTADRLLAGHVVPEDAPPGYARVAALVTADWTAEADGVDPAFLTLLAATVRPSPAPKAGPRRRPIMPRIKLAAALTVTALAATTGLAFAGGLPGAAQDIASDMLAKAGVTVPGPNSNAGDHPATREPAEPSGATPTSSGKGSEISDIARSDLSGLDKGAAVSTAASDGKSQAGEEHGAAGQEQGAPVATPNTGGAETADTASAGHSTDGIAKADEASSGHSSAGSANAAAGQSHRP